MDCLFFQEPNDPRQPLLHRPLHAAEVGAGAQAAAPVSQLHRPQHHARRPEAQHGVRVHRQDRARPAAEPLEPGGRQQDPGIGSFESTERPGDSSGLVAERELGLHRPQLEAAKDAQRQGQRVPHSGTSN